MLIGIHRKWFSIRRARSRWLSRRSTRFGDTAPDGVAAKTATLKVKYADFNQIAHSKRVSVPFREVQELQVIVDTYWSQCFR